MQAIELFQEKMKQNKIDYYIVPTSDYHLTEYISDFFKTREFLTNFTGSAGTLLVGQDSAYLWVDGRYFIQSEKQVDQSKIKIMKMGEPNVPSLINFIKDNIKDEMVLGFDGKVMSANFVLMIKRVKPNLNINSNLALINDLWPNRPSLPFSLLYKLDEVFAGESFDSKLNKIREKLVEYKTPTHLIASLEDQAWLYNLRANDIETTPVFLAFTVITKDKCYLFVDKKKLNPEVKEYLKENKITVKEYVTVYEYLERLENIDILVDVNAVNYRIYEAMKKCKITNKQNPSTYLKGIKNATECKNMRLAHINDAAAMIKFMYYLKNNYNKEKITELSAAKYLDNLRSQIKGYVDLSFETIAGWASNGAIIHYSPTPETDTEITSNNFLLVDSGGHYLDGTTDITRTFALGKVNDEMKTMYTTVLKAHIALATIQFPKGTNGLQLDTIARSEIWRQSLDFNHGTGHGVGYLLSVHEGPQRISKFYGPEVATPIVPGMITSNEPGIYLENKFGIRLESLVLCVDKCKTDYGDFYEFETLTYVPFDLDAIKTSMLTKQEKDWLNNYHKACYEKVSPLLTEEEANWLKENLDL